MPISYSPKHYHSISQHLYFNGFFQVIPGEPVPPWFSSYTCSGREPLDKWHGFLQAGNSSCCLTNSVKALKETQSTKLNQWSHCILSSITITLQREEHCSFYTSSNTSTRFTCIYYIITKQPVVIQYAIKHFHPRLDHTLFLFSALTPVVWYSACKSGLNYHH